ncbi:MAG: GNAT family N-acetyltransferase [Limnohabitans sp.]|nr:GNAT family N-acetyltransferase [Limnohabitans sp.]
MTLVHTLAKTTLEGGRQMFRFVGASQEHAIHTEGVLIPISPLSMEHVPKILAHLLSLSEHDRYLRFGYTATDQQIERYVAGLQFERDEIYGIFNRNLDIVAMAHLALMQDAGREPSSEFGVSVLAYARGRGYGARLFERAVLHARNEKVYQMYIHALSENAPMIRIARKAGATIERDGAETEAFLRLPKRDFDSRVTELVADQFAKTNYSIKEDAKRFWNFLEKVEEIRQGVRAARHQAAE